MSFFKKLKDRMFKSSSKIEEGLDAIVEDGGTTDTETGEAELARQAEAEAAAAREAQEAQAAAARELAEQEEAAREAEAAAAAARAEREEAARRHAEQLEAEARENARLDAESRVKAEQEAEDTARKAAEATEAARLARIEAEEQARLEREAEAEERRRAEQAAAEAETARQAAAQAEAAKAAQEADAAKPGLLGRLFGGRTAEKTVVRRALDDAMLESIEDLLITADMGVETAMRVSANLAEGRMGKKLSTAELKALLASEVARIMEPVARPMPLYTKRPQVVLVVGVNGSGKTTTIGKLASQFKAAGKTVVIAAGDTFRAAAVEQLQVWGERAGVPVLTAPEGSDPASLAFDAMTKAEQDGADLLMIDTAGRLQNRQDLMEELAKIVRVIRKKDPEAPHNTLLVLDATTGQNALSQVEIFQKIADVSGLVMTKLDGTAKGGVLVALADRFGLPIHAIGLGEQIDDLAPFDPEEFARALTGLE
ncbi:signal recognition particle-docking protein FtsY [Neptunicoccus cionae]|uniref:signal recognition particle-docking protein FtsY n=1 Tax=Neptunicoccus cionae TaxID=2035344 RepID=UPI000C775E90|nr:signal recognition particle-docking protein FtsY [Amylibacter cionae]PLS21974.1 signal recognition particle-docking protein FtsY [Amylibacter cionae]